MVRTFTPCSVSRQASDCAAFRPCHSYRHQRPGRRFADCHTVALLVQADVISHRAGDVMKTDLPQHGVVEQHFGGNRFRISTGVLPSINRPPLAPGKNDEAGPKPGCGGRKGFLPAEPRTGGETTAPQRLTLTTRIRPGRRSNCRSPTLAGTDCGRTQITELTAAEGVPDPSTLALLALGSAVVTRRRRLAQPRAV